MKRELLAADLAFVFERRRDIEAYRELLLISRLAKDVCDHLPATEQAHQLLAATELNSLF